MNLLLKIASLLALLGAVYSTAAYAAVTIQLPRTGQTLCYDAGGGVINCTNTGQDGNKLAGVPSPDPRFTDNGNGTVTDNLTGLIWLKDAGCFATVGGIAKGTSPYDSNITWTNALTWSSSLKNGVCALSDGSVAGAWRLPNVTELESLVELHQYPALASGHPFSNVRTDYYWSSSSYAINHSYAWGVSMSDGKIFYYPKQSFFPEDSNHYVWPVRAGQ